jgi:protein phosphatase PTC7
MDQVHLEHGDVVVFATDGLTDNLYAHEILGLVTDGMLEYKSWHFSNKDHIECSDDPSHGCQAIARSLVRTAMNASLDPNINSPFAAQLRKDLGFISQGGKPDDITVLVLTVCETARRPASAHL